MEQKILNYNVKHALDLKEKNFREGKIEKKKFFFC